MLEKEYKDGRELIENCPVPMGDLEVYWKHNRKPIDIPMNNAVLNLPSDNRK